jgi:hypothetical protein
MKTWPASSQAFLSPHMADKAERVKVGESLVALTGPDVAIEVCQVGLKHILSKHHGTMGQYERPSVDPRLLLEECSDYVNMLNRHRNPAGADILHRLLMDFMAAKVMNAAAPLIRRAVHEIRANTSPPPVWRICFLVRFQEAWIHCSSAKQCKSELTHADLHDFAAAKSSMDNITELIHSTLASGVDVNQHVHGRSSLDLALQTGVGGFVEKLLRLQARTGPRALVEVLPMLANKVGLSAGEQAYMIKTLLIAPVSIYGNYH